MPNAPTATTICHGIEALACKLEYYNNLRDTSDRILGVRAFSRDQDGAAWNFPQLRRSSNYVVNTHRQAATRALRQEQNNGLGFATGTRFDLLKVDKVGKALADSFLGQRVGKGGTSLQNWLSGWLTHKQKVPDRSDTLRRALSPEHPTNEEQELVGGRLYEAQTIGWERRQRLARAIGRHADLPNIETVIIPRLRKYGHHEQADQIIAARAFGAMLDSARDATSLLTQAIERDRAVPVSILAQDPTLRNALSALKRSAEVFSSKAATAGVSETTSKTFAESLGKMRGEGEAIRFLVGRVREVLTLADGSVTFGRLFRVIEASESLAGVEEGSASIEPDSQSRITGRTFRIANLHALLRDVGPRKKL